MTHRGWLKDARNGISVDELARQVLERLGDAGKDVGTPRSFSTRLGGTDAGRLPTSWWDKRTAVVEALADVLGVSHDTVKSWVRASAAPGPTPWVLSNLPSLGPLDPSHPPPGLWSNQVEPWVDAVEAGHASVTTARLAIEPGLPAAWLKEWFRARNWKVISGARWRDAERKVKPGERFVVCLDNGAADHDSDLPDAPRDAQVLVLAYTQLRPPQVERRGAWSFGRRRALRADLPCDRGWLLLDAPSDHRALEGVMQWFKERAGPAVEVESSRFMTAYDALPDNPLPGELLALLDAAALGEPVNTLLARFDDVERAALVEIEIAALRQGNSLARPLATWQRLVPEHRTAEDVLTDMRRALKRKSPDYALVHDLASSRRIAVIETLRRRHLLQPNPDGDGTWLLWPRWLGQGLRDEAARALLAQADGIGAALLADEDVAEEALNRLRTMVRSGDLAELHSLLRIAPGTADGAATIEGVSLALGHHLLDGGDMAVELANTALAALRRARGADQNRWDRLLPRGDSAFSLASMILAEWALAWRADDADPRFGPWVQGPLSAGILDALVEVHQALDKWSNAADPSGRTRAEASADVEPEDAAALARRVLRLGTLLYSRRGLLPAPVGGDRVVWAFQVPALLIQVCVDEGVLPGRTGREALLDQGVAVEELEPLVREFRSDATRLLAQADQFLKAALVTYAFDAAEQGPEATLRKRARDAIVTEVTTRFSLVRDEVQAVGGSFSDGLSWLWARWNDETGWAYDAAPVRVIRDGRLDDARMIWQRAPAVVQTKIWKAASKEAAFWQVLDTAGWLAWGRQAPAKARGWPHMPVQVLLELLDDDVPIEAYDAVWTSAPSEACAWTLARLESAPGSEPLRKALNSSTPRWTPELLARASSPLPVWWLQRAVTRRDDGWREAWQKLVAARAMRGSPEGRQPASGDAPS